MNNEKTLLEALQDIRFKMSKTELKKSGYNSFAKFSYFELKDFLPTAIKEFNEAKITPIFNIEIDQSGVEYAILMLHKGAERILFKVPTAEANGSNPIQSLGAKITYLRRYLYLVCLDLVENDIVDAGDPKAEKVDYATPFQTEKIFNGRDKIREELMALNIKTKNEIKSLTRDKASELCDLIDTRNA